MEQQMPHDMKEIDGKILDELAEGRNVPSNLAETLDVSRQWITQRLQQMESADYVTNVGRGVYELVDDPREDAADAGDEADLRGQLQDALESRDDAQAKSARLEERVSDLQARLEQHDPEAAPDTERLERALRGVDAALTALAGRDPNIDGALAELESARDALADALGVDDGS